VALSKLNCILSESDAGKFRWQTASNNN